MPGPAACTRGSAAHLPGPPEQQEGQEYFWLAKIPPTSDISWGSGTLWLPPDLPDPGLKTRFSDSRFSERVGIPCGRTGLRDSQNPAWLEVSTRVGIPRGRTGLEV